MSFAQSQSRQIAGKVTDSDGQPVAGADVLVAGTTNGTSTDHDGNFVINASSDDVLRFAFLGFVEQSIKVGSRSVINVTLAEDSQVLDDVLVIGYGTIKKSSSTGSQASVSDKSFAEQKVTRID
ncbi:MAG: carboxypeptidase-like regulatory domain-containing protein, partial [Bacteroidales bacterium]|nr:carboxypeptidase-like regulatory domain-containing protein [Bacteroidales bacterium]